MSSITRLKPRYSQSVVTLVLDRFRKGSARYVVAVVVVLLGYILNRIFHDLLDREIYVLPFISILTASVICGSGPGLLATILAAAASYQFTPGSGAEDVGSLVVEGALVSFVGGSLRHERNKVREYLEENLRLEQQIIEISDDERRRIGHDLHDRLGQHLTGISMLSETVAQQLMAGDQIGSGKIETITRLVSESIGITRDLARSLSPLTLEREGLASAMSELAEISSSVFGIQCVCESSMQNSPQEKTRSLHIFRIVQEAVSNSVRHGKAKNVRISLKSDNTALTVTVVDDGIGLSPKTSANPGLGLQIMQYRARMLGASLTVSRTDPSGGTTITCTCPL